MPLPLILDTDIGMDVDDAIALCFAALDPRFDLRAVTTVNGDTQKRACVARALLRVCGRDADRRRCVRSCRSVDNRAIADLIVHTLTARL